MVSLLFTSPTLITWSPPCRWWALTWASLWWAASASASSPPAPRSAHSAPAHWPPWRGWCPRPPRRRAAAPAPPPCSRRADSSRSHWPARHPGGTARLCNIRSYDSLQQIYHRLDLLFCLVWSKFFNVFVFSSYYALLSVTITLSVRCESWYLSHP